MTKFETWQVALLIVSPVVCFLLALLGKIVFDWLKNRNGVSRAEITENTEVKTSIGWVQTHCERNTEKIQGIAHVTNDLKSYMKQTVETQLESKNLLKNILEEQKEQKELLSSLVKKI